MSGSIELKQNVICSTCLKPLRSILRDVKDDAKRSSYKVSHWYDHEHCNGTSVVGIVRKIKGKFSIADDHKLATEVIRRTYDVRHLVALTKCKCDAMLFTEPVSYDEDMGTGVDVYVMRVHQREHWRHGELLTTIERNIA